MAANTHSLSLASASSQAVSITDAAALKPTGNFTVEMWVKIPTSGVSSAMMFQSFSQNTNYAGFYLFCNGSDKFEFVMGQNTGTVENTNWKRSITTASINTGIWVHIAVTYDGSNIKQYINGFLDTTTAWTNNAAYAATNYVRIGCYNTSGTNSLFLDASIDEVRMWSTARTQAEIQANMFRDVTGDTNLIDSWKLNNDYTSTSGSNNGTAIGTPTFSTTVPFPTYTSVSPVQLASTTFFTDANLQGYWKTENVNDSGPHGYNLTNNNGVTFTAGKFNNAAAIASASSQSLSIANASCPNLEISGSQTWGVWAKFSTVPSATAQALMGKSDASAAGWGGLYQDGQASPNQGFAFNLNGLTTATSVSYHPGLSTGAWYFVIGVYDSTNSKLKLYLNGILVGQVTASGTHTTSNGDFALGMLGAYSGHWYFDGQIDDSFVFNRALTDTEVFNLYTGLAAVAGNTGAFLPFLM